MWRALVLLIGAACGNASDEFLARVDLRKRFGGNGDAEEFAQRLPTRADFVDQQTILQNRAHDLFRVAFVISGHEITGVNLFSQSTQNHVKEKMHWPAARHCV